MEFFMNHLYYPMTLVLMYLLGHYMGRKFTQKKLLRHGEAPKVSTNEDKNEECICNDIEKQEPLSYCKKCHTDVL